MRLLLIGCFVGLLLRTASAQPDAFHRYDSAFRSIEAMLLNREKPNVEKAVFLAENAYLDGQLDLDAFHNAIFAMASVARAWSESNPLTDYHESDSAQFALWRAAFHVMMDTVYMLPNVPMSLPLEYDTVDFFGAERWEHTFVSELLRTGKGNCHSLPLLYKLICQEIGTDAYLAFAPNHIYIKQKSRKHGWYNTELTSGTFPDDAWLMASGYISTDAIRSGLYMDTLGLNKTLALCLTDLAQGYKRKVGAGSEEFVLRCCDLALRYHPASVHAFVIKSSALAELVLHAPDGTAKDHLLAQLNATAASLASLDYREIPLEVYKQWMAELSSSKGRFQAPTSRNGEK